MKQTRLRILSLALLLTACGGQNRTTPPTTPVPGEDVLYYGEWAWEYKEAAETPGSASNVGHLSIREAHAEAGFTGSFGYYQICAGSCPDTIDGAAVFGTFEDKGLALVLFRVDAANNPVPVYVARDADGVISQDSRGRDVFEGQAIWNRGGNVPGQGSFTATQVAETPVLPAVAGAKAERLERQAAPFIPFRR
jgi:hypothetical protein